MSLGTPQDVEASLLRPLTATEQTYCPTWLERAESLLETRVGDLESRGVPTDPDDPASVEAAEEWVTLVGGIEGEMVARVFRNPEGFKQEDEGNYSYRLDSAVASGLLTVLDSEWALLGVPLHPIHSVAGAMDGYAQSRYGGYPVDQAFQYAWPGYPGRLGTTTGAGPWPPPPAGGWP
jgi:hypothetical protein